MTNPENPFAPQGSTDRLDVRARQGKLMIIKVRDKIQYVRSKEHPDGMVHKQGKDPFPNSAIRVDVADLDLQAPDGSWGVIYPASWFQAASLMKILRPWIGGQMHLVRWDQINPMDKSSTYNLTELHGDPAMVQRGQEFLAAHPEFLTLPEPPAWDGAPPPPPQPQQQPQWQGHNYGQPSWAQQQSQPGYPMPPQQPPAAWNTAAPPPEYYQQGYGWQGQGQQMQPPQQQPDPWAQPQQPYSGPPAQQGPPQQWQQQPPAPQGQWQQQGPPQQAPQAQQGAPGSFFAAAAQQPPQQWGPPQQPQNHHGNWQNEEPPF